MREFSEPAVPVSEAAGAGTGLTAERREPVGVVVGQADRGLTQRAALSAAVAEQRAIKDSAIAPFYDRDLARRVREVRQEWIDRALEVISDNLDGAQLARIRTATAQFVGQEPTMFASGDLPPNTASGVDPSILQWSAWEMRHSAAYAESRAQVLEIIGASANGLATDPQIAAELSNQRGRDGLSDYLARVNEWAATLPAAEPGLNTTEIGKKVHAAGVGFQRGDIGHPQPDWSKLATSAWRKARATPRRTTRLRTCSTTKEQRNDQLSQLSRTIPWDST